MRKTINKIIVIIFIFSLASCKVSRSYVGVYDSEQPSKVQCKDKDVYLFWDMVQLQSTEKICKVKNYEKVVKRNLFDNVVYYGTLGIFSFYTVKIKVNKSVDNVEKK